MRSIYKEPAISGIVLLAVLTIQCQVFAQKGLGSSGVAKPAPAKGESHIRTRDTKAHVRRAPSPRTSVERETTTPDKPVETTPVPGMEEKNLGIESYNKDDYDKAIEHLNAAAASRSSDAEIFYYLGDSYSAKKQYPEAIGAYERARRLNETLASEENYFNLGYAYEVTQNNNGAFGAYQKALEKKRDNPETLTHLGDVSSKLKDWKSAIDSYERAFSVNPTINDAEVFFNWGLAYANSAAVDKAAPKFEKAVALNIDNISEAYYQLGRAYKLTGKFREAVDAYRHQLEKKADDDQAYWANMDMGEIFAFELHDTEAALNAYQAAVKLNGKQHETWFNLGSLQNNMSRYPEAAESYRQAVLLKPDNFDYKLSLGKIYWRLQRFAEAIETLNQAIELNPRLSEAYYYRGLSYKGREQHDQAVESFNKGIELGFEKKSMEGNARYNLAFSYSKLGNLTAARQQCDVLRNFGPEAPLDNAGICK